MLQIIILVLTLVLGGAGYYYFTRTQSDRGQPDKKESPSESLLGPPKDVVKSPAPVEADNVANQDGATEQIVKTSELEDPVDVLPGRLSFKLDGVNTSESSLTATVLVRNNSKKMGVFKVRTNRRKRYIVVPSMAYLKPGHSKEVKITLRSTEIEQIENEIKAEVAGKKLKPDTFLVQWMNVTDVFYLDDTFFDSIKMETWLKKASNLIKKVESEAKDNKERRAYFIYEKIRVKFTLGTSE